MTPEQAKALREPFPKEAVGKIPKGGMLLDYVGHAACTDRLLAVDAAWWWEPLALDEQGLPAYDKAGGLWIKLYLCGTTTIGYGDGPNPKERIGDALRNAAMRRGVALDLWAKEDLTAIHEPPVVVVTDAQTLAELEAEIDGALGLEGLAQAGEHVSTAVSMGLLSEQDRQALAVRYKRTAADLKAAPSV